MKSIKEILSLLSASDLSILRYAFEEQTSNVYIIYEPGKFVGVNILDTLTSLHVEQRAGLYASGTLISKRE